MNLSILSSAWRVFRAGEMVANPTAWKQGQVTANMVTVALAAVVSLLKGLGYDPHIDDTTLAAIGVGLFALVNWVFTVITTDKVGITGRATPAGVAADAEPARDPEPPARAAPVPPFDERNREAP